MYRSRPRPGDDLRHLMRIEEAAEARREFYDRSVPSAPHFGRWLLAQRKRSDAVGRLARHAARDVGFPQAADAPRVIEHVALHGAPGAVDAARAALEEYRELDRVCL